jgi:uncharacterized protein Gcw-chp
MGTREFGLRVVCVVVTEMVCFTAAGFAVEPEAVTVYEGEAVSEWVPPSDTAQALKLDSYPTTSLLMAGTHKDVAAGDTVDVDSTKWLSITVTNDWASKYMFRGLDIHNDSGAYQPSVEFNLKNGLTFGLWTSFASGDRDVIADPVPDVGGNTRRDFDEFDYYASYSCSPLKGIDLEIGWVYYDFPHLNSNWDYHEPYGIVTLSSLPLSPYFGAYYGFPKHENVGLVGNGWNTTFGVSHSVPMGCLPLCGNDPLSLDLSWEIWHQGGQFDLPTGWVAQIFGLTTTIPLGNNLEFTPAIYWQDSLDSLAGEATNDEDEWWTSLSLAYTW